MAGRLVTFVALATALLVPSAAGGAVEDTQPPHGAVGGVRSQAAGVLTLSVLAVDDGSGLQRADATLDGVALASAAFGDGVCCPAVGTATLEFDSTAFADGPHELMVTARDAAGNVATLVRQTVTVANTPPQSTPTVVVRVGSGTIRNPPSNSPGGPAGPGEKGCRSPRLSVFLASAPLRFRKGSPVLAAGRRYRYRGRLTCRIDGKRRAAPRGTVVQLRSVVRGRVVATKRLKVGRRGRFSARLAFRSSRVLVFRVQGAGGNVVRVRLRIRIRS